MSGQEVPLDRISPLVQRWKFARCEARRLKAEADRAEAELFQALGDAEVGTVEGKPVVRRTWRERPRFNMTGFRSAHPDLLEAFTYCQRHQELVIPRPRPPRAAR